MTPPLAWRLHPQWLAGAACLGLVAANAGRANWTPTIVVGVSLVALASLVGGQTRILALAVGLSLAAWAWGSARLDVLDRSVLAAHAGRAQRSLLVVTGPARRGRFQLRVPVVVERFGRLRPHEPAVLQLPLARPPPQGARLEAIVQIELPRGDEDGFDEATWLRRHGVHVLLKAERWRAVGRRGGVWGAVDRLRGWLLRSIAGRLGGERRGVIAGVVLGDDTTLSPELRDRFRASGLYHLLAVSGQNVALVAGGVLGCVWFVGAPRILGQLAALVAILLYVLAVGAQPSVVRAGIAGGLVSLAWLTARQRDRWHFLLLGAVCLLAWNPYTLLDAGFELSFAAVAAIFALVPRLERVLAGYPVPGKLAGVIAVSSACGLATAPIVWLNFGSIPLLAVPANAIAAPAVVPLLGLGFATALSAPLLPPLANALAWLNGWCAAYLIACARLVGGLPFAQASSGKALAASTGAVALAAYAWLRCRRSSSRSTS